MQESTDTSKEQNAVDSSHIVLKAVNDELSTPVSLPGVPQHQKSEKERKREAKVAKQIAKLQEERAKGKRKQALYVPLIAIGVIGILLLVFSAARTTSADASQGTGAVGQSDNVNLPAMGTGINDWLSKFFGKDINKYTTDAAQNVGSVIAEGSFLIGLGIFFYARAQRRKYIKLDRIGMLISTHPTPGEGDARFIPWGCLTSVDVTGDEQDDKQDSEEAVKLPKQPTTVVFYVDDGSSVKIKWEDIMSCTEPGSFINAIKTWAPDTIAATTFPGEGEVGKIDNNTYTQLWFKYYSTSSQRKRTTLLAPGEKLMEERFTVAGQLGGGGQGTAYLAVDNQATNGQPSEVVLKEYILPVHRGQQILEATVKKLHQEATILRNIDHPHIVKLLDEFIEDHRGYLVMEYVAGKQLKEIVVQEGAQPEATVRQWALEVCDILSYLHGMTPPVIHRDLTPDNLILQEKGGVKLVDFNVAHQLESAATATVVGKHCYIPPEQFRGKPTIQSDIYALGCTLHYLLTGEEPEPLSMSHPRQKNERVSESMDKIVAACTALDAARRFADVEEVKEALLHLK